MTYKQNKTTKEREKRNNMIKNKQVKRKMTYKQNKTTKEGIENE